MQENNYNLVDKIEINKSSTILVVIPTYNSYEITRSTVSKLYNQTGVNIDILVVDNGSSDYSKLSNDFSNLSYISLKKNTGSSGAQWFGINTAVRYKYDYVVLTDNDAVLIGTDALGKLYKVIESNRSLGCVVPSHIELPIKKNKYHTRQLPLHYLFVRTSIFNSFDIHNFYLFLLTDDVSLVSKIVTNSKLLVVSNVSYYHDIFKPRILQNISNYFYIRGFLIILLKENGISVRLKLIHFGHLLYKIFVCFVHSIVLLDYSYIITVYLAFRNYFTCYKEVWSDRVPQNKYVYVERDFNTGKAHKLTALNTIFPKKCYYLDLVYFNKRIYFVRTRNTGK